MECINLHTTPKLKRILRYLEMMDLKPATEPLPSGLDWIVDDLKQLRDAILYCQLIRSFHLASTVWPDLAFAVNYLSRFMNRIAVRLWHLAVFVFGLLKGGPALGLAFLSGGAPKVQGYSDDGCSCGKPTRKWVTGNFIDVCW